MIVLAIVTAYLIGSIPFALLLARRWGGHDLHRIGSGNIGAANVLRASGVRAGVIVAMLDIAKGSAGVLVAGRLSGADHAGALAGFAAIVGHIYPVFHRFRGGKGVATALGVLAGFSAPLALVCGGVWAAAALLFRYSSLAAICAAVAAPFAAAALIDMRAVMGVSAMSALLIFRHRENIRRLLSGTESRIGAKKQKAGT